jgi:hypothetical protein
VEGANLAGLVFAIVDDAGALDAGLDGRREGPRELALGPLDVDGADGADVELDLVREGDGFFSNTGHECSRVKVYQT